ncbi:formyltetrahydrofolate deformylase [Glycomyces algeriensis]|uniref:Formyltetrahydrofolate deformylase n=1 Tax=Glycomyces algeriensis TaxID=256037 RepID=A0A9W6G8D7_9ACTN|nr:formyltetrahydrofolate deformylase [Glycomyces algeriensis]MDA1365280.1 formyltetrahydrofolate deformylase [Glycomyces algeriensis]MDR7349656.1 formyltetrahydrofolate deformylase [Glycomyces algeriensis]GLI42366.1 formyltetrahydrofolate deformylase [Glycomyces algeriensis]
MTSQFVLTLSCPDRLGIVYAVSGFLTRRDANIEDSQQFSEHGSGRFFMRVEFNTAAQRDELAVGFADIAREFDMDWQLHDRAVKRRVLIMASKQGHCLNDLLYRFRIGALHGEAAAVVSNHPDWADLAASSGVPFHYLPVGLEGKAVQEQRILDIIEEERIDTVVLARYMQILSSDFCAKLPGKILNIHHSFLPSFKGAKPYHQAHERGVKLIGATCHYVTADLDEGPIVEQEVARVDHAHSPEELVAAGRDLESTCLARGLAAHLDDRVLINGTKTVVFR